MEGEGGSGAVGEGASVGEGEELGEGVGAFGAGDKGGVADLVVVGQAGEGRRDRAAGGC